MKKFQLVIAALVVTGMAAASATSEAKVRDPISRKTSPERGFFESRPSSSAARVNSSYVRTNRAATPAVASRPATSTNSVVTKREVIQAPVAQPRSRFIRTR